ncbi:MAG: hypothetical protein IJ435_00535 [Clostridia bacterium]|nr:hypothetical protein [Clostridia bacterium]
MKKAFIAIISLILVAGLVLSVVRYRFNFYDSEQANEYSVVSGTDEEIAENVMEQYFDYYKAHGLKMRLADYRINEIALCEDEINEKYATEKDGFVFRVTFDVKPFFGILFDDWYAGNGKDAPDGWCVDKTGYHMITVEDEVCYLEYIGTMC